MASKHNYRVEPIPRMRRFALDAGYLGRGRHIIHGLIEADVTQIRDLLREHQERTGEKLSFTAFVITCLAQAIASNPHLHAYRAWGERLIIYDDINITAMVEVEMGERKVPMPHVFEATNKKSLREIHDEMRITQQKPGATAESQFMRTFLHLPAVIRRAFYRIIIRTPQLIRRYSSSVMVTAVGMFGRGGGWGIPISNSTLTVTVGGIVQKPGVYQGEIAIRDYLDLTLSIDHDIVDGAPAARFAQQFQEILEHGNIEGIPSPDGAHPKFDE